ncbi:MAG: hypothetical protein WC370_04510 [Dehalococcoidales bacterium]
MDWRKAGIIRKGGGQPAIIAHSPFDLRQRKVLNKIDINYYYVQPEDIL